MLLVGIAIVDEMMVVGNVVLNQENILLLQKRESLFFILRC